MINYNNTTVVSPEGLKAIREYSNNSISSFDMLATDAVIIESPLSAIISKIISFIKK